MTSDGNADHFPLHHPSITQEDDLAEVAQRLRAKDLPAEVRAAADKELRRLKRMQPSQPEFTVLRNYLDWVLDLPWTARSARVTSKAPPLKALKAAAEGGKGKGKGKEQGQEQGQEPGEEQEREEEEEEDEFDVVAVEAQLEKDHYGLGKVKRRILEYIAVRSLTRSLKGAFVELTCLVLCCVVACCGEGGGPGVLCSSITKPHGDHGRPHPVPGGPARRGQDEPGALHRHGPRPPLPAPQPRRGARCVACGGGGGDDGDDDGGCVYGGGGVFDGGIHEYLHLRHT